MGDWGAYCEGRTSLSVAAMMDDLLWSARLIGVKDRARWFDDRNTGRKEVFLKKSDD